MTTPSMPSTPPAPPAPLTPPTQAIRAKRTYSAARTTSGFTLLELLLTLSMSVVLVGLVGGALQFYAVDMNVHDMDVRQTQLASAVMQMIENDLRATLHAQPVDTSGLEALLASTAGNVTGAAGGEAGQDGADLSAAGIDSGVPDDDDSSEPVESSSVDLQSGAAVLETPGLIGNQNQIQIDLSRLPRLEEYLAMMDESTSNIDDVPSDLKTVAYYVQAAGTVGGIQDPLDAVASQSGVNAGIVAGDSGLVRRTLDRAATIYASNSGNSAMLNQTGELLAPEITGIEFSYWDGTSWLQTWSSDEYGELPLAVQVRLYMATPQAAISAGSISGSQAADDELRTFMHVVRLPLARPVEEEEDLSEAGI